MSDAQLQLDTSSKDVFEVREFNAVERMSSLFVVELVAVCDNPDVVFGDIAGMPAAFRVVADGAPIRIYDGICSHIQQVKAEGTGVSTYRLTIVPRLWFATQRRNYRIFQQISEPDIVEKLLSDCGVTFAAHVDRGAYKTRKYRVQYAESDYDFMSRLLEDSGISYYFNADGEVALSDAPQLGDRVSELRYVDGPFGGGRTYFATNVSVAQQVRPGQYTIRDHDYRRPAGYPLVAGAAAGLTSEQSLERYHYVPGAFLFGSSEGESTPVADDKGKSRHDKQSGAEVAERRLQAKRAFAVTVDFDTNAHQLRPGMLVDISHHPSSVVSGGNHLMVTETVFSGAAAGEWRQHCRAVSADAQYRPPLVTPKPRVQGVESATVVGPPNEEIHTDEFGRVRVHFHWDRMGQMDDNSSCWIHVSQSWAGSGFGSMNLPRVGQEVLVDFLGGDPDRPVITGRVHTGVQKVPYSLPANKTQSGWRSCSSPGGDGYNEIMFEDRKGSELLYVRAEKDREKLVRNDEANTIIRDRSKAVGRDERNEIAQDRSESVGRDEKIAIGQDRTEEVGRDERIVVGKNRTRVVKQNESVTVAANRSKKVGVSETLVVGVSQNETVGVNRSLNVGAANSENVGGAKSVTVGAAMTTQVAGAMNEMVALAKAETVGLASAETVGLVKALTVGQAYKIAVGASMSVTVGKSATESVSESKTVTVGEKVTIECGASVLTMDKDGMIAISGKDLTVTASGKVKVVATGDADIESSSEVNVKATKIMMN